MKITLAVTLVFFLTFPIFPAELNTDSLVSIIENNWKTTKDYTLTLKTYSLKDDKEEESIIEQKFLKPKWIYAKVTSGKNKGSVGVYNPITKKVKGHQGGLLKFIVLTLDPSDKKTSSIRGHRIDQSSCGTLVQRLINYRKNDEFTSICLSTYDEKPAYLFTAEIEDTSKLWGATKEMMWINAETLLPLHLEQFLANDKLVHYSTYWNIKINTGLTEDDFKP